MSYYPIFLNLKGKRVFLFGAGNVGFRKAKTLIAAGANLSVFSAEFSKDFIHFAKRNKVSLKKSKVIPKNILQAFLVIAATNNSNFNNQLYRKCEQSGILINVVDDPRHSSFIVPSVIKQGELQIAISTGGASPLLAKTIRKQLEKQFSTGYRYLVTDLAKKREQIKGKLLNEKERRKMFQQLVKKGLSGLKKAK